MLYKIAAPIILVAALYGCAEKSEPQPCPPVPVCSYEECPTIECSLTDPRKPKLEIVKLQYEHSHNQLRAVIRNNEKEDSPLVKVILTGKKDSSREMRVYVHQTEQRLMRVYSNHSDNEVDGNIDWFKVGDWDFNIPECYGTYNPEKKEWESGNNPHKSCEKSDKLAEQVQKMFTAYASILDPIKDKLSAKSEEKALKTDDWKEL